MYCSTCSRSLAQIPPCRSAKSRTQARASSLDPATTARLLQQVREFGRKVDNDAFNALSEREMQVLAEVARGKKNAEIAEALSLSEKTVRNHVSTILEKLNLSNRVELATYAVEHHIYDRMRLE